MSVDTPETKNERMSAWKIILLIVVGLFVLGSLLPDAPEAGPEPADNVDDASAVAEAPVNPPTITAAEFGQISTGMAREAVEEIIGGPGQLLSESEIAGTKTQMFQWDGEGGFGANANAMFQNGKLIQKAQFGLE